eukprot:6173605-Pleurochrysis_carterae.AAC.1
MGGRNLRGVWTRAAPEVRPTGARRGACSSRGSRSHAAQLASSDKTVAWAIAARRVGTGREACVAEQARRGRVRLVLG